MVSGAGGQDDLKKSGRLNKSTVLQVSSTIQRQSKVNISNKTFNFYWAVKSPYYQ
jgi:hypothetical protein